MQYIHGIFLVYFICCLDDCLFIVLYLATLLLIQARFTSVLFLN